MTQRTSWLYIAFIGFVSCVESVNDNILQIQCDTTIASQITSVSLHDYQFNLSTLPHKYSNMSSLYVTIFISPSMPIEIYFANATIYRSCIKQCYLNHMPTHQDYIFRLNKYIIDNQAINYTLTIHCNKSYITTTIYTTNIISTVLKLTEFDYSVSFNQQLTFGNRGKI
eukprot:413695_1